MEPFTQAISVHPAVVSSLRNVAGLQQLLSFPTNSELKFISQVLDKHIYICINFYSYSRIDTKVT